MKYILILFSITMTCQSYSQYNDSFLYGRLLDAKSKQPVVFATVQIINKPLGVISDKDGVFRIPWELLKESDGLLISSMGYRSTEVKLLDFSPNVVKIFYLEESVFELNEALVSAKLKWSSAEDIIRYSINNIKNNYPIEKFAYVGYYRDYQLKNDNYVNLNEGIVKVFDKGFNTIDTSLTMFQLYNYRKNLDFEIDSFSSKKYDYNVWDKYVPNAKIPSYGGCELMLLRVHDPIRNHRTSSFSYIYNLREDFIKNHQFYLEGITEYNNNKVYEIIISKETEGYIVEGKLYIDKSNFAIRKLKYSVNGKKYFSRKNEENFHYGVNANSNINRIKETSLVFEVEVEYKNIGDKMYLNYSSFKNVFEVKRPAKFKIEKIILNPISQLIEIKFNNYPKKIENLKVSDFKFKYDDKQISFKSINIKNKKTLELQIDNSSKRKIDLIDKLFSNSYDENKVLLTWDINRFEDLDNNKLGERETENIYQFREFMNQEVITYPLETLTKDFFLKKDKSLDDENQPVLLLSNEENYWMNTPLKTIK